MKLRRPSRGEILMLRGIADYQFGYPAGDVLIGDDIVVGVSPSTRRIREVYRPGYGLFLVLRAKDYMFSLSIPAAKLLIESFKHPKLRAVVSNSIVYKSIACSAITEIDDSLRPGDEVIAVSRDDELIGVGRLRVSPLEISGGRCIGEAIRLRKKIRKSL